MRGDERAVETARELEETLVQQRVASMTLFELYYGVASAVDGERERERIEAVLASKPIHPADAAIMRKAGRIAGELRRKGTPIDDGDVVIGATAAVLDEPVLTRNVEHFERLDEVEVETY